MSVLIPFFIAEIDVLHSGSADFLKIKVGIFFAFSMPRITGGIDALLNLISHR
ncbi:hypothetical protein ACT4IN_16770 [Serratia marcescens]